MKDSEEYLCAIHDGDVFVKHEVGMWCNRQEGFYFSNGSYAPTLLYKKKDNINSGNTYNVGKYKEI